MPQPALRSQPAKAVWIEIVKDRGVITRDFSHSLRRLCGLKCQKIISRYGYITSQPAKAVWIEMALPYGPESGETESQPAKAVWIEISAIHGLLNFVESQPAKAVWIEMITFFLYCSFK